MVEIAAEPYLAFDPQPRVPAEMPPANACDSQFHVSGEGYRTREGATYHSDGATVDAARHMHRTLGIDRGVLVQSTVYATDHSLLLDALAMLGANYRGIGVMDDTMSDAELARLDAAGVRGVRFSFLPQLNLIPSDALFLRSAARCRELGWILKVNLARTGFTPEIVAMLRTLGGQKIVIDHMARIAGREDPNCAIALDLLSQGNVWVMMSNGHRLSPPHHAKALSAAEAFIAAAPDRLLWGSDWPHPLTTGHMPNDADLLELFYRYTRDDAIRRQILVDNPAALFGFARP